MEGYSAKIVKGSREFTAKERIILKDTSNAVHLDEATANGKLKIMPVDFAVIEIHNEKSENKDYNVYVIMGADATKYVTGSLSFFTSFEDIWDEMKDSEEDEDYEIEIYRVPSKNYKGKDFITCSLI